MDPVLQGTPSILSSPRAVVKTTHPTSHPFWTTQKPSEATLAPGNLDGASAGLASGKFGCLKLSSFIPKQGNALKLAAGPEKQGSGLGRCVPGAPRRPARKLTTGLATWGLPEAHVELLELEIGLCEPWLLMTGCPVTDNLAQDSLCGRCHPHALLCWMVGERRVGLRAPRLS